jgi:uncharacterized membrane protein YedE/YeeE
MNQTVETPTAEKREPASSRDGETGRKPGLFLYLILGIYFGIVLTKSEAISWFRIQEMFRFQGIHMYGMIGGALVVAALSVAIIKKRRVKTIYGEEIYIPPKDMGKGYRYWIGGIIFGLGWALLGACPGPIFALIGNGVLVMFVALASAVAGTWVYGYLRPRLPH